MSCHFLLQCMKVKVKSLSCVQLLATPWTAAHQAPQPMGFSRQEYWEAPICMIISENQYKDTMEVRCLLPSVLTGHFSIHIFCSLTNSGQPLDSFLLEKVDRPILKNDSAKNKVKLLFKILPQVSNKPTSKDSSGAIEMLSSSHF